MAQATITSGKDTDIWLQTAYRELLSPRMGGVAAGIVFFLLVQYTVLGPLGTAQTMGVMQRLAYWGLVGGLQFPVVYASGVLTLFLVRYRRRFKVALALTAMVSILAATCTAIAFTIFGLFQDGRVPDVSLGEMYGVCALNLFCSCALMYHVLWLRLTLKLGSIGEDGSTEAKPASDPDGESIGTTHGLNASTAGAAEITPDHRAHTVDEDAVAAVRDEDGPAPASRLFDRMAEELGRDIIYLKASAHHVEVTTSSGSETIVMRISDAVADLGNLGMQVHRSYWVAFRHVKHVVRREGRTLLRLTSDHEVPISRTCIPEVRAAVPKAWIRSPRQRNVN